MSLTVYASMVVVFLVLVSVVFTVIILEDMKKKQQYRDELEESFLNPPLVRPPAPPRPSPASDPGRAMARLGVTMDELAALSLAELSAETALPRDVVIREGARQFEDALRREAELRMEAGMRGDAHHHWAMTSAGPEQPSYATTGSLDRSSWQNATHGFYMLADDGATPVPLEQAAWAAWMVHADRQVARTETEGGVAVSTVFTGVPAVGGAGVSLWETRVLGGPRDGEVRRYSTKASAVAGHAAVVASLSGTRLLNVQDR